MSSAHSFQYQIYPQDNSTPEALKGQGSQALVRRTSTPALQESRSKLDIQSRVDQIERKRNATMGGGLVDITNLEANLIETDDNALEMRR